MIWMWVIYIGIIIQRLIELVIAKNNEKWMKERGGIETGQKHYKWFVFIHCLFFIAIFAEVYYNGREDYAVNYFLLSMFLVTQFLRIWCIVSLGRFWNTKIIVLPRVALIRKGPYKYVKHPNYIIVGIELLVIPLLFGAYLTAVIFPIIHLILLKIRIPKEEKALTMSYDMQR